MKGKLFLTFKTDAITKIDSQSSCTSVPGNCFFFQSGSGDFHIGRLSEDSFCERSFLDYRKKVVSMGNKRKENQDGTSCRTRKGTCTGLSSCQRLGCTRERFQGLGLEGLLED